MKPIAIHLAVANCHGIVEPSDVQALVERCEGFQSFVLVPGEGTKAGTDWVLLLEISANAVAIAGFLWAAYERLIAPKRGPSRDAGIHAVIRSADRVVKEFSIGNNYQDRDIFLGDFVSAVKREQELQGGTDYDVTDAQVRQSGLWIRRK